MRFKRSVNQPNDCPAPCETTASREVVIAERKREDTASRPRAVACDVCGHPYIQPCTAETEAVCPNMIWKRGVAEGTQQSIRHHYIPMFYSKRWSGDDGRLCEISRPRKELRSQRVYPKQTGFQYRLYERKGVSKSIAQQVEDVFMSSVDNFAANALGLIETDVQEIDNDAEQRSAWSLFLMTLMTRMPEDLTALTQIMEEDWKRDLPFLKERYAANRKPNDPDTIEEFIEKKDPEYIGRWVMDELPELTDHEGVGQSLNAMRWSVVTRRTMRRRSYRPTDPSSCRKRSAKPSAT